MKKLNFAIFGTLMLTCLATQALAETTIPWTKEGCESVKGTWITAHSATDEGCSVTSCNGMNFCKAPITMNWFNALIWCQSIGHKLATFSNLCPRVTGPNTSTCTNIAGISTGWAWSDIWENNSLQVNLSSGKVEHDKRTWNGGAVVCEK